MHVQKSIEIQAPPEQIWPYLVEPAKVMHWCITFKQFAYTTDQQSGVGTPVYIEELAGGSLSRMNFEATEWRSNEKVVLRMTSGASYPSYVQHWSIEPTSSGSRFTFMEDIVLPYGFLGRLMGVFAERMSAATVDKMLVKLKAACEAG